MLILYHFRTRGTGAEGVHIAGIARAFERLGHAVEFSSPTGIDPRQSAGADPFSAAGKGGFWARVARRAPRFIFELLEIGYNAAACWRTWRMLRQKPYDLIYERHAFFLFATAWLAQRRRIPLVIEVNELVGDERVREQPFMSGFARWCDRFSFGRASLIVVVSPHLKRRIKAMGVDGAKILVLPNAVDEGEYARSAQDGTKTEAPQITQMIADGGESSERGARSAEEEGGNGATGKGQGAAKLLSCQVVELSGLASAAATQQLSNPATQQPHPPACHGVASERSRVVLGFVGWLVPWHRLDDLVDVVAELAGSAEQGARRQEARGKGQGARGKGQEAEGTGAPQIGADREHGARDGRGRPCPELLSPNPSATQQPSNVFSSSPIPASPNSCPPAPSSELRAPGFPPPLRLLLVGDGPLRGALEERARALGIADRLVITGAVPHADIPRHISGMDIAVIPHSNQFRSPIKLFEYMGQGVAVVAPRTEPIEMVVRDGVSGALFEPGDTASLRACLQGLLESPERRRQLGAQARADILAKHTWRHNAEAILRALKI